MESFAKIGVDAWSVLLYMINFGLLFAILGWFLYKPIRKAMDDRKDAITGNIHEAEHLRDEMQNLMDKQAKERADSLAELQSEKKAVEKMLAEKQKTLLAEMEAERSVLLEKTRAQIADEKSKLLSSVEEKIISIIKKSLFSIMAHHVPEDVVKSSVKNAWDSQKENTH